MSTHIRLVAFTVLLLVAVVLCCKTGNMPPTINDFTAADSTYPGGAVLLVCSATDPEGDPISYAWTCTRGSLASTTDSLVTWTAPDSACVATITVEVADSHQGVASRQKNVTVSAAANRPPVINVVTGPDSADAGGTADLSCDATDPDGDALTYSWTCNVGGLSSQTGPNVTWYAPDTAATADFVVIVSDGQASDTAIKTIGVRPMPNRPPVIDSIVGPSSVSANGNTTLTCFATDPDGDPMTYSWMCTRGRVSPSSGQTITWHAPDTSGSVLITATVRDDRGGEVERTKTINVTKVTTTWLDKMESVSAGDFKAWYGTLKAGYTVWGSFSVSQKGDDNVLDINFYVLDSTNYYKWRNNQSGSGIVVKNRSSGASYSATVPRTCRYYVVLDNTYSLFTNKIVTFVTKLTSP